MKSILEELFCGHIYPAENIFPKDPEYSRTFRKIEEQKELWEKTLPADTYQKIEELDALLSDVHWMSEKECFYYGFRLGAILMAEVYGGKEDLLRHPS